MSRPSKRKQKKAIRERKRRKEIYDIGEAIAAVERELLMSMKRNLEHHKVEEIEEDMQWTAWQAEQMNALAEEKKKHRNRFHKAFQDIRDRVKALLLQCDEDGQLDQEEEILEAVERGAHLERSKTSDVGFFRTNDRKLEELISAVDDDMLKAQTSVLRQADDIYRRVIYKAHVYANTGAGTYEKAVDMAVKDFAANGIQCIVYKNGSRHTMEDYCKMAIQTASKRAYLAAEGRKRQEWGIHTVIMNRRVDACPQCMPFQGKILIDDVWSGGHPGDGPFPLLSSAIAQGLYHPRCKDTHTTYFPGLTKPPENRVKRSELRAAEEAEQEEISNANDLRNQKKWQRLADLALDDENRMEYQAKADEYAARIKDNQKGAS